MEIRLRFLLLPTELGARKFLIRAGYRADWDNHRKYPIITLNGASIINMRKDQIYPGEIDYITIRPFKKEFWDHIKSGDHLCAYEGKRLVGVGQVLEILNEK